MVPMESLSVEIVLKHQSSTNNNRITGACEHYLRCHKVRPASIVSNFNEKEFPFLHETVAHLIIGECVVIKCSYIDFSKINIVWYMYALSKSGQHNEVVCDEEGNEIELATTQMLPAIEYFNLWENLIYDSAIKNNLLKYTATAMLFADKGVDNNVVNNNRVVLLYGPPGTGKTSLCKALAHKLSIRLSSRFKRGILLEINSHSLFSKWFSESGKLVTKMFQNIWEYLKDQETIVFVLIDEIESLTHARERCMSGVEPSDSIRAVNAVLTQVDQIKNSPNVIILTTSNMTKAIDLAFVDRADIKQYIGLPSTDAIYQIYYSCIQELLRASIIQPQVVLLPINMYGKGESLELENSDILHYSKMLHEISDHSEGFSGRTLRKIPFLAHALFIEKDVANITEFFDAMLKAIELQKNEWTHFSK